MTPPNPIIDTLNRPLRDLRISVTDRCNLRCKYCMPEIDGHRGYPGVPRAELLTFEETERIARAAVGLGVRKLRVTGGEPLLRRNLPELVAMLAAIDGVEDLALTTNGLLLPQHAQALRTAGLHRVTVSLDALDDDAFQALSGRPRHVQEVLDGIDAAREAGLANIKVNVVILRGVNEHAVLPLVEHFRHTGVTLRFIEYMDVGNVNHWQRADVVPSAELLRRIAVRHPVESVSPAWRGEVATRYRYADGGGEVGFISSITAPFCGDCNRLRLAATGDLYTCLFSSHGTPLRDLLRSGADDAALRDVLARVWLGRSDRYSEERFALLDPQPKVEMHHIGG